MKIEVVQCGMCKHYDSEQYCEVWGQYITNDAFYCACGVEADRKTEPSVSDIPTGSEPQTDGYMTAEQTEHYRKMLDKAKHKVYGNIEDEPQTDCAWMKGE